jgi:hypothetical protein
LGLGVIRVVGNALDIGLLADEERESVGERGDVWRSTVAADTGVGQAVLKSRQPSPMTCRKRSYLVAEVLSSSTTADLRASIELSTAPTNCGIISICFGFNFAKITYIGQCC